jgi:hypothetical protein
LSGYTDTTLDRASNPKSETPELASRVLFNSGIDYQESIIMAKKSTTPAKK